MKSNLSELFTKFSFYFYHITITWCVCWLHDLFLELFSNKIFASVLRLRNCFNKLQSFSQSNIICCLIYAILSRFVTFSRFSWFSSLYVRFVLIVVKMSWVEKDFNCTWLDRWLYAWFAKINSRMRIQKKIIECNKTWSKTMWRKHELKHWTSNVLRWKFM